MNLLDAEVRGATAIVAGVEVPLGADYGQPKGRVQIGVRPEFVTLASGDTGLDARVRRVEDVGRHKIVRCDFGDAEINVIVAEGQEISPDMTRLIFDPKAINVYADDWRVSPKSPVEEAA
jgi:glycerol transport system ATP-binding protein